MVPEMAPRIQAPGGIIVLPMAQSSFQNDPNIVCKLLLSSCHADPGWVGAVPEVFQTSPSVFVVIVLRRPQIAYV